MCVTFQHVNKMFFLQALHAFHIEAKDDLDVELFDLNVPKVAIDLETFPLAILQFQNCSHFGVEIRINNMEISTNVAVSCLFSISNITSKFSVMPQHINTIGAEKFHRAQPMRSYLQRRKEVKRTAPKNTKTTCERSLFVHPRKSIAYPDYGTAD